MPRLIWGLVTLCALGVSAPAMAQGFRPIDPSTIVNRPIDLTNLATPMPALGATNSSMRLPSLFRKLPSFSKIIGTSGLPTGIPGPQYRSPLVPVAPRLQLPQQQLTQ
jgi:hypothetical protein